VPHRGAAARSFHYPARIAMWIEPHRAPKIQSFKDQSKSSRSTAVRYREYTASLRELQEKFSGTEKTLSAAGMVSQQGVPRRGRRSSRAPVPVTSLALFAQWTRRRRRRAGSRGCRFPFRYTPPWADGTRARNCGFLKLPAMRTEPARASPTARRRCRGAG
jgi:hypothetical protein